MKENLRILSIKKQNKRIDIDFQVSDGLKKYFRPERHFFLEYSFDVSSVPSSIAIVPILCNLLQISWLTDSIIWVDELDYDFYHCILRLKNAFQEMYPQFRLGGTLIAARLEKNRSSTMQEALLLFTGGVDATTSMLRNREKRPILFNTNGWYSSSPNEENPVYEADTIAINSIGASNDLDTCFVKSNFATFINADAVNRAFGKKTGSTWWFGFQHSVAFIGCAMVAAYYKGARSVYIASSYTFGQYIICVSDPRIDSEIRCAGIETVHDGYELSRQDKVRLIVQYQNNTNREIKLRVCSFNTHNCCKCEKCFRTMLALLSEGAKDVSLFGFELDKDFLDALKEFIQTSAMELDHDHAVFWKDIIERMRINYDSMYRKDVYEYLKTIDFSQAKRNAVINHYRKDYKEILRRKLRLNR